MKKHIICYGDSNTHGYDGESGQRFNEDIRWTKILQELLGEDYLVIEEGLNGRTTVFEDPIQEGMSGLSTISPILLSHEPVDLLIIMLGTNDTKERFSASAQTISFGLGRLVKKAMDTNCWNNKPNILVISPKSIDDEYINGPFVTNMGRDCSLKSKELAKYYQEMCNMLEVNFIDADKLCLTNNKNDFMHLDAQSHAILAQYLSEYIKKTYK